MKATAKRLVWEFVIGFGIIALAQIPELRWPR